LSFHGSFTDDRSSRSTWNELRFGNQRDTSLNLAGVRCERRKGNAKEAFGNDRGDFERVEFIVGAFG
jgi:hypothetical protein